MSAFALSLRPPGTQASTHTPMPPLKQALPSPLVSCLHVCGIQDWGLGAASSVRVVAACVRAHETRGHAGRQGGTRRRAPTCPLVCRQAGTRVGGHLPMTSTKKDSTLVTIIVPCTDASIFTTRSTYNRAHKHRIAQHKHQQQIQRLSGKSPGLSNRICISKG